MDSSVSKVEWGSENVCVVSVGNGVVVDKEASVERGNKLMVE